MWIHHFKLVLYLNPIRSLMAANNWFQVDACATVKQSLKIGAFSEAEPVEPLEPIEPPLPLELLDGGCALKITSIVVAINFK